MNAANISAMCTVALVLGFTGSACSCDEEDVYDVALAGQASTPDTASVKTSGITIARGIAVLIGAQPMKNDEAADADGELALTVEDSGILGLYRTKEATQYVIAGGREGSTTLTVTWKDKVQYKIPVTVSAQRPL